MAGKTTLLVDPDDERRDETVELLKKAHVNALTAKNGAVALQRMEAESPDLILCDLEIEGHSPRELCEYVHEFVPGYVHFVLVVPEKEEDPESVRKTVGADLVVVRPLSERQIDTVCSLLFRISELRTRVAFLEEENIGLRRSLGADLYLDAETQFYRFDIFKHIILMEIKKAKRYGHVVSLLLLTFDRYREMMGWLDPDRQRDLFDMLKKTVVNNIGDIDIPLLFSEDKILVVMPHTDLKSAAVVADRIRDRVGGLKPPGSLAKLVLSSSAAVASTQGDPDAGFGTMIQNAVRGLKEADLKGGDVVIICRSPRQEEDTSLDPDKLGELGPRTFFV
jgi:PleD family two-component response regulator